MYDVSQATPPADELTGVYLVNYYIHEGRAVDEDHYSKIIRAVSAEAAEQQVRNEISKNWPHAELCIGAVEEL
jgi:hypothetical protein